MQFSLSRELQGLLKRLITAPGGIDAALTREVRLHPGGIDGLIAGGPRLGARKRVEIYANAYFHRLLDCLKEDYPVTLAVIGEDAFRSLVVAYLAEHPSDSPSIFEVGRVLPEFMIRHPVTLDRPFLGELCAARTNADRNLSRRRCAGSSRYGLAARTRRSLARAAPVAASGRSDA